MENKDFNFSKSDDQIKSDQPQKGEKDKLIEEGHSEKIEMNDDKELEIYSKNLPESWRKNMVAKELVKYD